MKARVLGLLPLLGLLGCSDTVPLPAEFDAAFTKGRVCIPSKVATGGANTVYPMRFELCVYDCITLGADSIQTMYSGSPGGGLPGTMVVLATAHATTNAEKEGCDARLLADPPAEQCTMQTFDFSVELPNFSGTPATGDFLVTLPYLELEQGDRVMKRLEAGEPPLLVMQEEVGQQNYPERQFLVNFDAANPVSSTPPVFADSDCHDIPAP